MPLDRARWCVHSTWMSPPDYIDDDIGTAMLLISMDSVRNLIDALRTRDAYTVRLAIQQECCVYLICLRCNLQFSVIDECTMFSSLGMHWIEWFTRLSLSLSVLSQNDWFQKFIWRNWIRPRPWFTATNRYIWQKFHYIFVHMFLVRCKQQWFTSGNKIIFHKFVW